MTDETTRGPTRLRTADILEQIRRDPTRARDVAQALGVLTRQIPGHLTWLKQCGVIATTRVRGYYVRTDKGDEWLAQWRFRSGT